MNTLFVAAQAVLLRGDFKSFQVPQMTANVVLSALSFWFSERFAALAWEH